MGNLSSHEADDADSKGSLKVMADLISIPQSHFKTLSEELKSELPVSLKLVCLLSRHQMSSEVKCFAKLAGTKPDSKVVVVKNADELFMKYDLDQDYWVFVTSQDNLTKLMENKTIMDSARNILFRGILDNQTDWFNMVSRRHGGHLHMAEVGYLVYQLVDPIKLITTVPPDVELGPITEDCHIHMMRVSWLLRETVSSEEFARTMLSDLSVGLYLAGHRTHGAHQAERHLVSWAVTNLEGSITLITTVPGHQHKGYSQLVVSNLSNQLLALGRIPISDIDERREAKQHMFESLGFKKVMRYRWGYHVPDDNPMELEKFNHFSADLKRIDGRVNKPVAPLPVEEPKASINIRI